MKAKSILTALLLMVTAVQTVRAQKVVLHKTNGQTIEYNVSELDSITFEQGHDWVDLGLPSGTLWSTCNIGANSPEEYGDYFAWGETTAKADYSWSTYRFCDESAGVLTKYCTQSDYGSVDGKTELDPEDDAATANWGSEWQMPNKAQWEELLNKDHITRTWTTRNSVNGYLFTSKSNGNSLFIPAAGGRVGVSSSNVGSDAYCWSRSLHTDMSFCTCYYCDSYMLSLERYLGLTVRPVRVNNESNKFCNLPARLTIENVQQAPVLFTACESMGEYCTITSDGQSFNFTDATNYTSSINITAMNSYSGYYLGLSGFIIGKLTVPEIGEDKVRVVCYDRACPNCYQDYSITKPLVLQTGGYARCSSCGRTYNLNDVGNISDGPAGRTLYRYRVNYTGYTLVINNE